MDQRVLWRGLAAFVMVICLAEIGESYSIGMPGSYFIVYPKQIRPGETVAVSVSIFQTSTYGNVIVRCSAICSFTYEVIGVTYTFSQPGTQLLQMLVPKWAPPGYYLMRCMAWANDVDSGQLFLNESVVFFDTKQVSIFVQTSKLVYHQSQVVYFRVIPVYRNLLPFSDQMNVYVHDATGAIVRRWLYQQPNAGGVISNNFTIYDQVAYGNWTIRVNYKDYNYRKNFLVEEYFQPRFDVNITTPYLISDTALGVVGIVWGNHTSSRPSTGVADVYLQIRDPLSNTTWPTVLTRHIPYFSGVATFFFTMKEILSVTGRVSAANLELYFNATIYDWFWLLSVNGSSYTFIYPSTPQVMFLGGRARVFKPSMPLSATLIVYDPSGVPTPRINQVVQLTLTAGPALNIQYGNPVQLPIPDDGVINYQIPIDATAQYDRLELTAQYIDLSVSGSGSAVSPSYNPPKQMYAKAYSFSSSYLQVSTTTQYPFAGQYMVFKVESSVYVPIIYYQIAAGGNIVYADQMSLGYGATSHTFAVAVSRDMLPVSRIICYYIRTDGEVVADALTFFVNGTRLSPVNVQVNRAKDLRMHTIEVNGYSDPASFMSFSAINYDYYVMGGYPMFTEYDVIDELLTYDPYSQQPWQFTWTIDREYRMTRYFNAPTLGVDANTTWEWSGLRIFTDTNRTAFWNTCNATTLDRTFPCLSVNPPECYTANQTCNGIVDCYTGVDEMNCDSTYISGQTTSMARPKSRLSVFRRLSRHYDDGAWMWQSYFIKPDSEIEFRVTLPRMAADWVIGAFSMSPQNGFGVQPSPPPRFTGVRRFWITLEYPTVAIRGEQIGLRVAVFNYWTYWTEALVYLNFNTNYKWVMVGWRGRVSSYAPATAYGEVHNVVYVPAGQSRYILIPILPINYPGNVTFAVCAYAFVGADCQSGNIYVKMDGVTNFYQTPYLLDLTVSAAIQPTNLWIPVNDVFIDPTMRQQLYVPGSQMSNVSVVGDVVGPSLDFNYPFYTTEDALRRPYYGAEQTLFNLQYNLHLLKYLRFTNQLTDSVMIPALMYCNQAYQRVLSNYIPSLGAFTNFRDFQNEPSVWATAWAYNVISEAGAPDITDMQYYLFVDLNLLANMTAWLSNQQNTNMSLASLNGGFAETGPVFDRKFRSNATYIQSIDSYVQLNLSLTAHVVIALTKAQGWNLLNGTSVTTAANMVTSALQYLVTWMSKITDPFEMSIVTYALSKAGSNSRSDAFRKLQSMAFVSDTLYWADSTVPSNPYSVTNSIPFYSPRQELGNDGYATEATAYALLSYMLQQTSSAPAIVKWLSNMRNTNWGFASTSDTLIALEALRAFAEANVNRALWGIQVSITAASTPSLATKISISNTTFSQYKTVFIPRVYGSILMYAVGTGYALLQLNTMVNVEYQNLVKPPVSRFWDVWVDSQTLGGRNFSIMEVTTCARWLWTDKGVQSGMAVIELDIPTGYWVMNDDLRRYVQSGVVPTLRHAYIKEKRIAFHLQYISSVQPTCVNFRADRWYPVANTSIQYMLRVYEFYETGVHNTSIYTQQTLFNLHICHVCGSFQCPYCPDYNAASSIQTNLFVLLASTFVALGLIYVFNRRKQHILSAAAHDAS